jgi:hypothetical protein
MYYLVSATPWTLVTLFCNLLSPLHLRVKSLSSHQTPPYDFRASEIEQTPPNATVLYFYMTVSYIACENYSFHI